MRHHPDSRSTSGFTLFELLISVAVLAILAAILFPAVAALQSRLKMTRLDAAARGIYVATQNQLTALRAGGGPENFAAAQPLSAAPSDAGEDLSWESLRYLSSMDSDPGRSAALAQILPAGAIDPEVAGGFYVIEFDPSGGSVYAVFYSERSFDYSASLPRDEDGRRGNDPPLGYYGGDTVTGDSAAVSLSAPQVTVLNGETLDLILSTANPFSDVDAGTFFRGLSYLVTVRSATHPDSAVSCTFSTDGTSSLFVSNPVELTCTLTLDSLTEHFKDLCPGILPGDDLTLTVVVSYSDRDRVTLPASAAKTVNSLFQNRTGDQAAVSCGRHLQNLEPSVSGVSSVTSAVQTAAVDWSYYGDRPFVPISNGELGSYNGSGLSLSGLSVLAAGDYAGLFGNFSGSALQNIRLVNEKVSGGKYAGGLFGYCNGPVSVSGCSVIVSDLQDVDRYTVSGTQYVGGLAGWAGTLDITRSFAAPGGIDGGNGGAAGGLVGYCGAGGSISRCYADTNLTAGSSSALGGLIGSNNGSPVSDCYALGDLSSPASSYYGGFVGRGSGSYTNCYAAASFEGAGASAVPYGFSGSAGASYVNCACLEDSAFSLGTPDGQAGPLSYAALAAWTGGSAWTATAPANSHPYSADLLSAVENGAAYPFPRLVSLEHYNDWPRTPAQSPLPGATTFCYFETYDSDGSTGYWAADGSGSVILDTLSDDKGPVKYDGYRLLSPEPLRSGSDQAQIFYQSADGQSPSADASSTWPRYTLVTISSGGESRQYYSYQIPDDIIRLEWGGKYATSNFYQWIYVGGAAYWYCPYFAKAAVTGASSRPAFGGTAVVRSPRQLNALACQEGGIFWTARFSFRQELDLDYSCARGAGNDNYWMYSTIGTSSAPFQGTYDGGGHAIRLTLASNSSRAGLFGFNAGTVQNVVLQNADNYQPGENGSASGGLAAVNAAAGKLTGCTVSVFGTLSVKGAPYGALAGLNAGTISGCLVTSSGTAVLSNHFSEVGGLIGENTGTITDSAVRPGISSYGGLTVSGSDAAGFACRNSGTIGNCYAVGTVTGETGNADYGGAGFVYRNSGAISRSYANCLVSGYYAAGFAMDSSASAATIQNCYAMIEADGISSDSNGAPNAAGFVRAGNAGVRNCYAAARVSVRTGNRAYTFTGDSCGSGCYYLQWKSCGNQPTGTGLGREALAAALEGDSANWTAAQPGQTHVYRDLDANLPAACPYPLLTGLPHYGDWLDVPYYTPPVSVFAYYEQYGDGSWGYYAEGALGSALVDTLSDTKGPVKNDGYVLLSPTVYSSNPPFTVQTSWGSTTVYPAALGPVTLSFTGNEETYYRYCLPYDGFSNCNLASSDFYQTVRIDGATYWYNPHFARAAVNGAASRPAFSGTVSLRSARQLANLGNGAYSAYWGDAFTFRQELDVDFGSYCKESGQNAGVSVPSGIGSSGTNFRGAYEGGGHSVTLSSSAINGRPGLFANNAGTVEDLTLLTSGGFTAGQGGAGALLAAVNSGTIQNCSIGIGNSLSANASTLGLLAGSSSGTIRNCTVTLTANLSIGNASSFGCLVGSNSGLLSGCLVTSSPASSVTLSMGYNTQTGLAVGANSGTIQGCSVRPGSPSYGALRVSDCKAAAGFVYSNSGTVEDCFAVGSVAGRNDNTDCGGAGFVYLNSGTVERSYANCVVSGYYAAGFAWSADPSAKIENCYAMGKVTSYGTWGSAGAAGFVYNCGPGVRSCYAAAEVSGYQSYTFSATTSGNGKPKDDCRYLAWASAGATVSGTACTPGQLRSFFADDPEVWGSSVTHVFRDLYPGLPDACPFPLLRELDHYGDWPPVS